MIELENKKKILYDPSVSADERLDALKSVYYMHLSGVSVMPERTQFVNNHIHTTYSFSPYTPSAALYEAWKAGLSTAGIMDHDSIGGAREFLEAGKILDMPATVGCELRVSVEGTKLFGKRLNSPDQMSLAYVAMHGIPHQCLDDLDTVLSKKREQRNVRNLKMCDKLNELTKPYGIGVSFYRDVIPNSMYERGGSVTERHILFTLVRKIIEGRDREEAISLYERIAEAPLPEKPRAALLDAPNRFFAYDLLGVMKSSLLEKIYVEADDELLNIKDYLRLCSMIGAISAYAYLGDVKESPTGDKKAQKFEDDYLNMLMDELTSLGFNAVTYMPSRNTPEQLNRVMRLCREHGLFQISGEDINQPRQSFICEELAKPEFKHLKKATYALIGHEISATEDIENAMFSEKNKRHPLSVRIDYFSSVADGRRR